MLWPQPHPACRPPWSCLCWSIVWNQHQDTNPCPTLLSGTGYGPHKQKQEVKTSTEWDLLGDICLFPLDSKLTNTLPFDSLNTTRSKLPFNISHTVARSWLCKAFVAEKSPLYWDTYNYCSSYDDNNNNNYPQNHPFWMHEGFQTCHDMLHDSLSLDYGTDTGLNTRGKNIPVTSRYISRFTASNKHHL